MNLNKQDFFVEQANLQSLFNKNQIIVDLIDQVDALSKRNVELEVKVKEFDEFLLKIGEKRCNTQTE